MRLHLNDFQSTELIIIRISYHVDNQSINRSQLFITLLEGTIHITRREVEKFINNLPIFLISSVYAKPSQNHAERDTVQFHRGES